ncbi:MAG: MATE family efflux transporter [Cellulosilyticaceae bacterium]
MEHNNQLGTEKVGSLLIKFAVPSTIAMLVNAVYNIVDQIFIGQGVGYLGNAATNVAFPLVTISIAIALMIGNGGAAFYSLRLGEGKEEEAAKAVGNSIVSLLIAGVGLCILGSCFFEQLLRLFGATDKVMPYAIDYIRIIIIGMPFAITSTGLSSMIRADGNPRYSMNAMLVGAVINVVLDPIFIFGLGMGVKGAAIATIIGQVVSFVLMICYIPQFRSIKIHKNIFKLDGYIVRTVLLYGISSFITQIAITLVQIVMNNTLKYYGAQTVYGSEIPLSVVGIVMKVNMILNAFIIGIATGAQPILGYNLGARQYHRVKQTYWCAAGSATCIAILGFICFQFFPHYVVAIFGSENALYNEFALKCFRVFLGAVFVVGFQIVSAVYFQAVGKPIKSAILSLSRQVLFLIPLILILPIRFGIDGALYAGPIADVLAVLVTSGFIYREIKHLPNQDETREIPQVCE